MAGWVRWGDCHPWCEFQERKPHEYYHGGCRGLAVCLKCGLKRERRSHSNIKVGPTLFCTLCSTGFFVECIDPHKWVGDKILYAIEVEAVIKAELPQPIWEEVLEHLQ